MKSYSIFLGLQLLAFSGVSWAADSNNKFFVKCLIPGGGEVLHIQMNKPGSMTIAALKEEALQCYNNELGTAYLEAALFYCSQQLQDGNTLADCDLGVETTIHLVPLAGQGNYAGNAYTDPTSSCSDVTFGDISDNDHEITWSDGE